MKHGKSGVKGLMAALVKRSINDCFMCQKKAEHGKLVSKAEMEDYNRSVGVLKAADQGILEAAGCNVPKITGKLDMALSYYGRFSSSGGIGGAAGRNNESQRF